MIKETISITAKVTKYWTSLTLNDSLGSTKNKSKLNTLKKAANMPGARPKRTEIKTITNKYSMTTLAKSNQRVRATKVTVTNPHPKTAIR